MVFSLEKTPKNTFQYEERPESGRSPRIMLLFVRQNVTPLLGICPIAALHTTVSHQTSYTNARGHARQGFCHCSTSLEHVVTALSTTEMELLKPQRHLTYLIHARQDFFGKKDYSS